VLNRYQKTFLGIAVLATFGVSAFSALAQQQAQAPAGQAQQGQQAPSGKQWKDRAEYDMYDAIIKATDPNKKLALINSWKEKYPNTDYSDERLQLYLLTYQQLGQGAKMVDVAKEMLAKDPKSLQAMATITALTPDLNNTAPDALDLGEKAARGIVQMEKPQGTADAEWNNLKAAAHRTLGWVAMQKKDNETAEQEFKQSLKINPNNGVLSYWLGTVIVAQKKPEKQSEALYHFARAVSYDGQNAVPAQGRQQIETYLSKAYNSFHGQDPKGLTELKTLAKSSPFPPADFKIKSATEIAIEEENRLKETNPPLALWMGIKKQLTDTNGEQYFADNLKGAAVPGGAAGVQKLKGTLIAHKPAARPTELVLGLADPTLPEVTLKLDSALPGKAEPGTEIEFEGVPSAFTKDPEFMVTFDVERDKLAGWPAQAAPATKKKAPVRRKK
jgi:tetratricopeptide (TPR) repeat protein